MEAKTVRKRAQELQSRFFEAFEILNGNGTIKSLQSFCEHYELHRPKYSNLRNHHTMPEDGTGYKFIDIDALSYLVTDYGISAEWLLTGRGGMFKQK